METITIIFIVAIGAIAWAIIMHTLIKNAVKDALKETNELLKNRNN